MVIIEKLHHIKKTLFHWYKMYLTIEGQYTCILPDRIYLKKLYKNRMGKKLHLRNPKTFTEKSNWLKLYDRRPEYTVMADKYKAREFIAEKIGEHYLVPLLGVWDSPDKIDFDALPNEFVLKCNHDNGVIICRDKSTLDIERVKKELTERLQRDYYKKLREWPYKSIPRKIICEKYMVSENNVDSLEYKVFCFNGKPKYILVIANRESNKPTTMDTYDAEWNYMDLVNGEAFLSGDVYERPEFLDELLRISRGLSQGIPFVRVDFNFWNDKVYFGELTLYDSGGFEHYKPEVWDYRLGALVDLPAQKRR